MNKKLFRHDLIIFLALIFVISCGSTNPLQKIIKQDLQNVPEWSIVLDDMKEEGFFSTDYFHKYRILTGSGDTSETRFDEKVTDWIEVPPRFYRENQNYLGMTIASKMPGKSPNHTASPPGYQYVGDERYGRWRTDSHGNSFWEFYGKYALFRDLLFGSGTPGIFGRRNISMGDYQSYRRYRDNGRPFFGRKGEYGTYGSKTEKIKPNFYSRKKAAMSRRSSNFSSRVRSRMSRSSSSRSSRSFGRGK